MKTMHIINVFGVKNKPAVQPKNSPMVIHRGDGIVISIPAEAINATGFLRRGIAKRIAEPTVENMLWLNSRFGISFEKEKEVAYNG